MPFPDAKRIIFRKNPLTEVVCQLKFPPILKIDAEVPANFQEAIRAEFPNYREVPSVKIDAPAGIQGAFPIELRKQLGLLKLVAQQTADKNYDFLSEDESWKLTLSRNYIALTAYKYERWERFFERLQKPLRALISIYSPAYFTRIGLRYIDIINRAELKLEKVAWAELLKPFILGFLAIPETQDHVQNFASTYEIGLEDGESKVRIATKLLETVDSGEACFMIDSDFMVNKKVELKDAEERLIYLNIRASRLIQWCITDKLYTALDPQTL